MENSTIQFENQRVPFSSKNERSTEQDTHVQANHPKDQSQLDWLETQSTTNFRNVGRKERRIRKKVMGRDREKGKISFTRRRNYNRSMGCLGGH